MDDELTTKTAKFMPLKNLYIIIRYVVTNHSIFVASFISAVIYSQARPYHYMHDSSAATPLYSNNKMYENHTCDY